MNKTQSSTTFITLGIATALVAVRAAADPIIFTFAGIGSGSLGTNTFTAAPFTLTSSAETLMVRRSSSISYAVSNNSATVHINGIGSTTITVPTTTVVYQDLLPSFGARVGLVGPPGFAFVGSGGFQFYNLRSPIGPFTLPAMTSTIWNGTSFPTARGDFMLADHDWFTFEAVITPRLSIFSSSSIVQIEWFASLTNFVLESTTGLDPTTTWTPTTNAVVTSAGMSVVTLQLVPAARFFRLRRHP